MEREVTTYKIAEALLDALFPTDNGNYAAELNCEAVCGDCTYVVHVTRLDNGEVISSIIDNCGE